MYAFTCMVKAIFPGKSLWSNRETRWISPENKAWVTSEKRGRSEQRFFCLPSRVFVHPRMHPPRDDHITDTKLNITCTVVWMTRSLLHSLYTFLACRSRSRPFASLFSSESWLIGKRLDPIKREEKKTCSKPCFAVMYSQEDVVYEYGIVTKSGSFLAQKVNGGVEYREKKRVWEMKTT